MAFYLKNASGVQQPSSYNNLWQAVGALNNNGNPANWYITDGAGNIVYKLNGKYWGYNGNTCTNPGTNGGTTYSYIMTGDANPIAPWCKKGDNYHVLGPQGRFFAQTSYDCKNAIRNQSVYDTTQNPAKNEEANVGTMAYVYAKRYTNYNTVTATFDLTGAKAKDADSVTASRFGSNKWLYIQRNAGGRLMEAGYKMLSAGNQQSQTPYWQAYVKVQGVDVLYQYFDNYTGYPYRIYQTKNSTGVIDLSGVLSATISIASTGLTTVTYSINGTAKSHPMSEINSTADGYLKAAWSGPTNQQADYLYCVSDCYNMSNAALATNCFDLESGSYITGIKVTNAYLKNTNLGSSADKSFLISGTGTLCNETKLCPYPQARRISSTSTYDTFNLKHTITGL